MKQSLRDFLLNKPGDQTKDSSAREHPGLGQSFFILSYKGLDAMEKGTSYMEGTKVQDTMEDPKLDCWGLKGKRAMAPHAGHQQGEYHGR